MSDPTPPVVTAMAAGSQSLRDTAKWLVGGVVATAAAVFAGSSLTSLGALDPTEDRQRMLLALGALLVGFAGLAIILIPALRILVVEARTFREFATSTDPEISMVRNRLLSRYQKEFPAGADSFDRYQQYVDEAQTRIKQGGKDKTDTDLIAKATTDFATFNADAGFNVVRNRFTYLCYGLAIGTLLAILGFGVFAWAANPPPAKSPPPAFSLTIQGKQ
ncbi:hypothetical protein [Mesorhizobium loti]|uniref:hypothetical protein n=1 Tax=Rhizobium loti TaxID=381 RepID=UPI000411226C|nr:hypothetical protein [Mesorhizobium loti]